MMPVQQPSVLQRRFTSLLENSRCNTVVDQYLKERLIISSDSFEEKNLKPSRVNFFRKGTVDVSGLGGQKKGKEKKSLTKQV